MLFIKKITLHKIVDCLFIIVILFSYFYFAFDNLSKQGVHWDVGILGNKALVVYKNIHVGGPDFINVFNRSFPLMLLEYHGPVEIYFFLPALYLFGNTAFAINIVPVIFGGLVLVIFYVLIIFVYQSRILSILLSLLLSINPTFITANRIGFYAATLVMFFCLSSILTFVLWIKKRKLYWLIVTFLMLGFGMGSRCFFWWVPLSTILFLVFFARDLLFRLKMLRLREKSICFLSMSFALSPFIIYNLIGNFPTLRFFLSHLIISSTGIQNSNYLKNIQERIKELVAILEGNSYAGVTNNVTNIYILVFALLVCIISIIFMRIKKRHIRKSLLFPIIVPAFVFLQSPFTPSGLDALHIFYILPLILMIVAAAVTLQKNRYMRIVLISFLSIGTALSLKTNLFSLGYRKVHLAVCGGNEIRWNIAADVLKWLKYNNIRRIGLGDTGIMDSFVYLSGYGLDIEEIFYGEYLRVSVDDKEHSLRQRLKNEREGYYLFRLPGRHFIPYLERFNYIAAQENKKVEIAKEFKTPPPESEPVFIIYKVYDNR